MLPDSITALITALARLPGVGPRSAERMALHLVQADSAAVRQLADAMLQAREKIQFCATCGALTEKSPCPICDNFAPGRLARLRGRTRRGYFEH